MRRSLLLVVAVVVVGVATWVAMTGPPGALFHGAGSADPGPTTLEALGRYGEVPDFALTERSGRTVGRTDLLGTVWVASATGLDAEEEYLFFYPFVSTPCLLLDLGFAVPAVEVPVRGGASYAWGGGVGPHRSVVAFTAICPHQWSHPEPAFSAVGYHRAGQGAAVVGGRDRLIVCCAHGSAFDPAAGGRVEQGPAEIPLAAVTLGWDPGDDRLLVEGLVGPDSFDRFFGAFKRKRRALVQDRAPVVRLRDYSAAVARC